MDVAKHATGIKMTDKATIERLFQDLSLRIPNLSQDKWRHIFKELDQAPYDTVNVSANTKAHQLKQEELNINLAQSLDYDLIS